MTNQKNAAVINSRWCQSNKSRYEIEIKKIQANDLTLLS